jgi:hypothetical protein
MDFPEALCNCFSVLFADSHDLARAVRWLIRRCQAGASLQMQDLDGDTAMHKAAKQVLACLFACPC